MTVTFHKQAAFLRSVCFSLLDKPGFLKKPGLFAVYFKNFFFAPCGRKKNK
jgi:hypothetical protein